MFTNGEITAEAGRLCNLAQRCVTKAGADTQVTAYFSKNTVGEIYEILEQLIKEFACFKTNGVGYFEINKITRAIDLCKRVELAITSAASTIAPPYLSKCASGVLPYKLFELSNACGAFRIELSQLHGEPAEQRAKKLDGELAAAEYRAHLLAAMGLSDRMPKLPQPAEQPAKQPAQQPDVPTTVLVFIDLRTRWLEEEWKAAKLAKQQALVDSAAASVKDATNRLLSAIAQMGRA